GLVDGQQVTVTGSGFTGGAFVGMAECRTGATDQSGCATSTITTTTADPGGGVTATVTGRRLIQAGTGTGDSADPGAGRIGAANLSDMTETANAAIAFDPNVPPPPPLKFRVNLDRTDAVRVSTGVARITGTVTCNQPVDVGIDAILVQIF